MDKDKLPKNEQVYRVWYKDGPQEGELGRFYANSVVAGEPIFELRYPPRYVTLDEVLEWQEASEEEL